MSKFIWYKYHLYGLGVISSPSLLKSEALHDWRYYGTSVQPDNIHGHWTIRHLQLYMQVHLCIKSIIVLYLPVCTFLVQQNNIFNSQYNTYQETAFLIVSLESISFPSTVCPCFTRCRSCTNFKSAEHIKIRISYFASQIGAVFKICVLCKLTVDKSIIQVGLQTFSFTILEHHNTEHSKIDATEATIDIKSSSE